MRTLLIGAALIGLSGCVLNTADLAAVTPREIGTLPQTLQSDVKGQDCRYAFLTVLAVGGPVPSVSAAVDDAVHQVAGGNAMTDVDVSSQFIGIPYLLERNCVIVRGNVVTVARAE